MQRAPINSRIGIQAEVVTLDSFYIIDLLARKWGRSLIGSQASTLSYEHSSRTKGVKKKGKKDSGSKVIDVHIEAEGKPGSKTGTDHMVKHILSFDSRNHSKAIYRPLNLSSDVFKGVLLMIEWENRVIGNPKI